MDFNNLIDRSMKEMLSFMQTEEFSEKVNTSAVDTSFPATPAAFPLYQQPCLRRLAELFYYLIKVYDSPIVPTRNFSCLPCQNSSCDGDRSCCSLSVI